VIITGVYRSYKSVGGLHCDDVGNLRDIQQRSNSRQYVLSEGRGGRQDVGVTVGIGNDQGGDVFSGLVDVVRGVGHAHLLDAIDLCGCLCRGSAIAARYQHMNIAADLLRCGDGV